MLCDEHSDKAIDGPKTTYLKNVQTVQPTLYDGNVLIEPNHAPPSVTSLEESNVIKEETRVKLDEKVKDPLYIKHQILYQYDSPKITNRQSLSHKKG